MFGRTPIFARDLCLDGKKVVLVSRKHMMAARQRRVTREILSRSPGQTHRLGVRLARDLRVPGVLLLRGMLGMGKTTLARGVAQGLGLADTSLVSSPSYALINIYQARCPVYHVDLYRVSGERELRSIGIEDFLGREGVTIVEWSERLPFPPDSAVEVEIEDAGGDARVLRICYPAVSAEKRGRARSPHRTGMSRKRGHQGIERGKRR